MVKSLWEHFKVLYQGIIEKNPTIAAEHALAQEEEVYKKATKLTYRNVRLLSPKHFCDHNIYVYVRRQ